MACAIHVAFTFDDGPRAETTPRVLDALDRYGVPATFFVVGWRFAGTRGDKAANLEVLRDTIARGYHIGNHSFRHINLRAAKVHVMRGEIDRTTTALREVLGYTPHAFRPPFGAMNQAARTHVTQEGFTEMRWGIDTRDFLIRNSHKLRKKTIEAIIQRRGGVVLLHDTKEVTAKAISGILDDLERENCRRLEAGQGIIAPVSIHYFVRNRDGTARPVPPHVQARTQKYRDGLPARCRARSDRNKARRVKKRRSGKRRAGQAAVRMRAR